MSTYAEFVTEVKTAIEGWPGSPTRMVSDYRSNLERFDAGETKYQLAVGVAGADRANSNVTLTQCAVTARIAHRLLDAFSERVYAEGPLQAHLAYFTDLHWWRSLSTVRAVIEAPEVTIERIGNVVVAQVDLQVTLKP